MVTSAEPALWERFLSIGEAVTSTGQMRRWMIEITLARVASATPPLGLGPASLRVWEELRREITAIATRAELLNFLLSLPDPLGLEGRLPLDSLLHA